ncbi:MAG TPA: DUF4249 domain-containing protein [Daejeonella sp.]
MISGIPSYKIILKSVLIGLAISCSSCEEVIEPDLSTAPPLVVIEGNISDQPEAHTVKVSQTIAFDQPNTFKGIKGARVTVYSSNNQTFAFNASTDGIYRSQRFRGIPGVRYTLEVVTGGKTYKASSVMPAAVRIDSVAFKELSFFGNSSIYPAVYYKDPPGIQNQYRFIVRLNGVLKADQVNEDRFSDGNPTSDIITLDDGVERGDKVDLEVQCIDRNVFKYYFAVSQVDGNGGPPVAPSNPESNIDNGALGIFSANTRAAYTITLK